jgi:hypothetical protein
MAISVPWVLDPEEDPCCCVGDCCLYPGPAFFPDGLYPDTDLPETVVAIIDGTPITLTKSVSLPILYTGTWSGHDVTLNAGWSLYIRGFESGVEGDAAQYDFNCLITTTLVPNPENPPEAPSVTAIEDEFPDTLHVYWDSGEGVFEADVTRDTSCVWSGTDMDGNLFEILYLGDPFYAWQFQFLPFGGGSHSSLKTGDQNTPIGTYTDGAIVS